MHAIVLIAGSLDPHGQDVQKFGLETWLHLIVDGPDLVAAFPTHGCLHFFSLLHFSTASKNQRN